ncbi:MAG: hypothetical protein V3U20_05930 [Thermoplasmata archaeon]
MSKEDEIFTFETNAQVYREEHKSTVLTKLPFEFYQRLANYLERLRESYLEERNKDPTSPKSMMLEDEYNKAQKRASQIYEHRERKIVLLALQAANGGKPNIKLMTEEEKNAFEVLVDTLSKNRSQIMLKREEDACESETFLTKEQKPSEVKTDDETDDESDTHTEEKMEVKEGNESFFDGIQQENPVLLILEDIPSFETEERTFNLKKDDTITLPRKFARILCNHGKARVIQS